MNGTGSKRVLFTIAHRRALLHCFVCICDHFFTYSYLSLSRTSTDRTRIFSAEFLSIFAISTNCSHALPRACDGYRYLMYKCQVLVLYMAWSNRNFRSVVLSPLLVALSIILLSLQARATDARIENWIFQKKLIFLRIAKQRHCFEENVLFYSRHIPLVAIQRFTRPINASHNCDASLCEILSRILSDSLPDVLKVVFSPSLLFEAVETRWNCTVLTNEVDSATF